MNVEIVVWRHGGDWMKVYVDGKLERATHEGDYDIEYLVELLHDRKPASVTLRPAREDEPEKT
jgi:hypothetical protein